MNTHIKLSNGSIWPRPALESDEEYGVGNRLRYLPQDKLTREDLLLAAAICDAYGYMIVSMTQRARNAACSEIRAKLRAGE
ncbi:hypothetical protein BJD55_gp100 [Gordonia phage Yvonnetastic]|uniref:Uncharacterized protein n=1 Tax=Gordonia phage Yvonnetastic TaxID=1821566 RepID=A0A142K983_9CAUD|nr:hypothetical protein BJD55_gp100 [Gordonia phage Yvonnetastic]AMS02666.1 hypothetical protein SEA_YVONNETASTIC_122 [Gordonia phage Yvonnetastic]